MPISPRLALFSSLAARCREPRAVILSVLPVLWVQAAAKAQLPLRAVQATARPLVLRVGNNTTGVMKDPLCTIERYQGDWAWVVSDDQQAGWVKRGELVALDDAVAFFTRKIAAEPGQAIWRHSRGLALFEQGRPDEALTDLNDAVRLAPQDAEFRNSRGLVYLAKRDYDRALAEFNDAIRLAPTAASYWTSAGLARAEKGDFDQAIRAFDRALSLDPMAATAYNGRGNAWADLGSYDKALKDYDEAIRLEPEFVAAYRNRGSAFADEGHYEQALADYEQALALDPKEADAHEARAWLLATCPDGEYRNGKQAVLSARHACELAGWEDKQKLATLAAAYAEAGDFDSAVKYGEQALAHASENQKSLAAQRLDAYRAHKPWREKPLTE